ncbi:copper resistance CopC family protein [Asanoa sp. NPDC049573]|uniref:copper resistance CopC family protein n=1 Tax=Asanoa sp. NPDC049573 TaxID=3155396 RepID=UPI00341EE4C9
MRRYAATLAALLVGLVVVVAPASPASAHTKLSKAAPAAKATVTKPVETVTLTFSGLVKQAGTTVAVTGADGTAYQVDDARAVDRTITQAVRPLGVGEVTVAWQTVSGDGHRISGRYTFTNRYPPPSPAPSPTPVVAATATATAQASALALPAAAVDDGGIPPVGLAAIGAGVAAVLAVAVLVLVRRRRPRS